jgi:K(+)-stimulated pyrophosphate-energized sodium pump
VIYAFIISILIAVVITLGFAAYNFRRVSKMDAGTELMQEIARAIQEGSDSFIAHEYKIIASAAIVIALLLGVIIDWYVGVAFAVGTIMSALAGFIGMKIATISNVRVSNEARITKDLGKTMKVALRGGSVMGLSVGGLGLLGLLIVYVVFGIGMGQVDAENVIVVENWLGISFIPFTMTVTGYSLGCSVVALFDRVGGGIYTKAADMGADLVGKTEAHIPEDDPRNPATIADNVGDNVGDVAGLGSDLLESYIGAIISCIVLASYMFFTGMHGDNPISSELLSKMLVYPILFSALGLAACVIGIAYVLMRKSSDSPHRELNISLWSSAAMIIAGGAVLTFFFFRDMNVTAAGFKLGTLSDRKSVV